MTIEELLAKFDNPKKSGTGFDVRCPAHDDRRASLSISAGDDGTILMKCHAGCATAKVLEALGLSMADLFPAKPSKNGAPSGKKVKDKPAKPRETFATAAAAIKALEKTRGKAAGKWIYHDAAGNPVGVVLRWNTVNEKGESGKDILPVSKHGDGWQIAGMPEPRPLYRLPELAGADLVFVTEGELCADRVHALELTGTTSPHGSQSAAKADWGPLAGKPVVLLPDRDKSGTKYADTVTDILLSLEPPALVKVVLLPDVPGAPPLPEGADIIDWVQAHRGSAKPEELKRELLELMEAAPVVQKQAATTDIENSGTSGTSQPASGCRIDATEEDLAKLTGEAWQAIQDANSPPTLFRYGAAPSRIETDDQGAPVLRTMTLDRMRHRLARDASWFVRRKSGEVAIAPLLSVVRDVLATPDCDLPILTRIVEAPIFAADGTLCAEPGYNAANKTYYWPSEGFTLPAISERPSTAEVQEARDLIIRELLGDFPFAGEPERAHAVAALLVTLVRDMIEGPIPGHMVEAPGPGTGKTLLADLLTEPAHGRPIAAMTEARDPDEWRKRIFAKLRTAPSVVLLDNIKRRLESSALASVITSYPYWEDRVLGISEMSRVPVRCLFLLTGTNPAFSSEMVRRIVRIRLDAKVDRPWLREGFQHPDIRSWASVNRGKLLGAALTLIQAWIKAGRPEGNKTLGMFERWARIMAGILDVAGIPGFLENLSDFYETADTEGAAWREFVALWWNAHQGAAVSVATLFVSVAGESSLDLGEGKSERSQKIRLGKQIMEMRDRVFSIQVGDQDTRNLRVTLDGQSHRAKMWKLADSKTADQETRNQELPSEAGPYADGW
jgi:hypothetical protein